MADVNIHHSKVITLLGNMDRTKEVDTSQIMVPLNLISKELKEKEKVVIKSNREKRFKFILFHSIKTQVRFITTFIYKLYHAKENSENPKIVDNALIVYPNFVDIFNQTDNLLNNKMLVNPSELDDSVTDFQILSMDKSLYPSQEEVLKNIKKDELKKEVNEIFRVAGDVIHGS